jgi:hypothetical protein
MNQPAKIIKFIAMLQDIDEPEQEATYEGW